MNSYGTICSFADVNKLVDYGIVWGAPINKEQVVVVKTHICEPFGIVHFFVQAYDSGDVVLPEIWEVGLRSMERITWGNQWNKRLQHAANTQHPLIAISYSETLLNYRSQFCSWDVDH